MHFPGLPVTFGRGGRLCETAGGSLRRPPDGEAESGVAVAVGEVFAPGGQGGADPDRPLRLQRAVRNGWGKGVRGNGRKAEKYRAEKKSLQILLSRTQAGPGRAVKQQQEENSQNHVQAF